MCRRPMRVPSEAPDDAPSMDADTALNGDRQVRFASANLRYRKDLSANPCSTAAGRIVARQPDITAKTDDMVKKLSTLFAPRAQ